MSCDLHHSPPPSAVAQRREGCQPYTPTGEPLSSPTQESTVNTKNRIKYAWKK